MRWTLLLPFFVAAAAPAALSAETPDALAVLDSDAGQILHQYLLGEVSRQYAARHVALEAALASPEALARRARELRHNLRELVGELPPRTPLGARSLATICCEGYTIEKVIFESRPRHHVTANLYLPQGMCGRVPGVLVPCGHSDNGKANAPYQSVCALLALNGCAALIYDPIGQGERHQLPDATRHGTTEHTLVGIGALAVGWNAAHYRIWDGLRSMDYLAQRPEVDPARLGCTGNSGGGTMTTWLMALDERIAVAAPSCFITTVERLFATIGPQDCEQHFPAQGARGIDHADFITMRAPKPTLILAAEQDYFDFAGTRQAYAEAHAVYATLGQSDRVGLFSYDDRHGFSTPRREAAVRWMRRWLVGDDRAVREPPLTLHTDAELQVTSRGQVLNEFDNERTVVDLAGERCVQLAAARQAAWHAKDVNDRVATIRRVLGLSHHRPEKPPARRSGAILREGGTIETLVIERPGRVPLPALLGLPKQDRATPEKLPAVVYLDSRGKSADALPGGAIEQLVAQGRVVLSVDLSGYGETADVAAGRKYDNEEFRTAMLAMHVGRPLLSHRVEEVLTAISWLADHERIDARAIHLVGVERAGPVALHAAVIDERVASVTLRRSIRSWADDVVARPLAANLMGHVVPGALEHYDLPDLAALLGERLTIEAP